jgi:hypothetical protein
MVYINGARQSQRVDDKGGAVAPGDLKDAEFTIDEERAQVLVRPAGGVDLNTAEVEVSARGRDTGFYTQVQAWSRPLFKVDHHSNIVLRGLVVSARPTP